MNSRRRCSTCSAKCSSRSRNHLTMPRYLPKPVDPIGVEDSVGADNRHSILDANCGQQAVERVAMYWKGRRACSQGMWHRDGQDLISLQFASINSSTGSENSSLPRLCLIAISQTLATLTNASFPPSSMAARAKSSRVGCRRRRTIRTACVSKSRRITCSRRNRPSGASKSSAITIFSRTRHCQNRRGGRPSPAALTLPPVSLPVVMTNSLAVANCFDELC